MCRWDYKQYSNTMMNHVGQKSFRNLQNGNQCTYLNWWESFNMQSAGLIYAVNGGCSLSYLLFLKFYKLWGCLGTESWVLPKCAGKLNWIWKSQNFESVLYALTVSQLTEKIVRKTTKVGQLYFLGSYCPFCVENWNFVTMSWSVTHMLCILVNLSRCLLCQWDNLVRA